MGGCAADRYKEVGETLSVDVPRSCEHGRECDGATFQQGTDPGAKEDSGRAHPHFDVVSDILARVYRVWKVIVRRCRY